MSESVHLIQYTLYIYAFNYVHYQDTKNNIRFGYLQPTYNKQDQIGQFKKTYSKFHSNYLHKHN